MLSTYKWKISSYANNLKFSSLIVKKNLSQLTKSLLSRFSNTYLLYWNSQEQVKKWSNSMKLGNLELSIKAKDLVKIKKNRIGQYLSLLKLLHLLWQFFTNHLSKFNYLKFGRPSFSLYLIKIFSLSAASTQLSLLSAILASSSAPWCSQQPGDQYSSGFLLSTLAHSQEAISVLCSFHSIGVRIWPLSLTL